MSKFFTDILYQSANLETPLCNMLKKESKHLEVSKKVPIFASTKCVFFMSKKEKEEKAKEFWEYYEATQGTITITDPVVLD